MEELKMIIELAEKITDGAFWVMLIYFGKGFITTLIHWAGWLTVLILAGKFILRLFNNLMTLDRINDIVAGVRGFDVTNTLHLKTLVNKVQDLKNKGENK